MKKFLIATAVIILACLCCPIGWWILIGAIAFIVAVFELIWGGIVSLFSGIGTIGFAGAGIWPILAIFFIIVFIVLVIYIICS